MLARSLHELHSMSLLAQECGLKLDREGIVVSRVKVTPYTGVWIEITGGGGDTGGSDCHSLYRSVD